MIEVRKASMQDIKQLVKLSTLYEKEEGRIAGRNDVWRTKQDKKLIAKDISEWIRGKNNYFLVAVDKNKIIGFFKATIFRMPKIMKTKKICSLKELYVLPEYRSKKIASKLMDKIYKLARKKTRVFSIHLSPNNKKALAIYSKWDFKPSYLCMVKKIN